MLGGCSARRRILHLHHKKGGACEGEVVLPIHWLQTDSYWLQRQSPRRLRPVFRATAVTIKTFCFVFDRLRRYSAQPRCLGFPLRGPEQRKNFAKNVRGRHINRHTPFLIFHCLPLLPPAPVRCLPCMWEEHLVYHCDATGQAAGRCARATHNAYCRCPRAACDHHFARHDRL